MRTVAVAFAATAFCALVAYGVSLVRDAERAAQLKRAVELVVERDKIDAKLKTATPADICRRLGGVWLPDENECG